MLNTELNRLPTNMSSSSISNTTCHLLASPAIMMLTGRRFTDNTDQYSTSSSEHVPKDMFLDILEAIRRVFADLDDSLYVHKVYNDTFSINFIAICTIKILVVIYLLQKFLERLGNNKDATKKATHTSSFDKIASVFAGWIFYRLLQLFAIHYSLHAKLMDANLYVTDLAWKTPSELNLSFFYIIYPLHIAMLLFLSWRARKVLSNTDWTPYKISRYTAMFIFCLISASMAIFIVLKYLYVFSLTQLLAATPLCSITLGLVEGLLAFLVFYTFFWCLEPRSKQRNLTRVG